MANLPENTQYGGANSQPTIANFSTLLKNLQQRTNQDSTDTVQSSVFGQFDPQMHAAMFSPMKETQVAPPIEAYQPTGFEVGPSIGQQVPGVKYEAAPDYVQYKEAAAPSIKGPAYAWEAPTDAVKVRNWPTSLGGGQYSIDPTKPDAWIKSERVFANEKLNPGVRKALLGNLPSGFFEIEHTVPLWAGGADTAANLTIYDKATHAKKTKAQAIPLTLLANGQFQGTPEDQRRQARLMALTWDGKDISDILELDENGMVDVNLAKKIAAKWEDDKKPHTLRYLGEAFKENMANFGRGWLPAPVAEFGKGLVGGFTAGIVPATAPAPDANVVDKTANFAGNLAGMIVGLGKFAKLASVGMRATKGLSVFQKSANVTNNALKTIGIPVDFGSMAKAAAGAKSEVWASMRANAALLTAWGQLGMIGRELTRQEEFELGNHVQQAAIDSIFGSVLGSAGRWKGGPQSVRGYAHVGLGAAGVSLITSPFTGSTFEDAIKDGILMVGLHGMGYKKGLIDPKARYANDEGYKMAASNFYKNTNGLFPAVREGEPVPQMLEMTPTSLAKIDNARIEYQKRYRNDPTFQNVPTINTTEDALNFLKKVAIKDNQVFKTRQKNTLSEEQIAQEMTAIETSFNILKNQTLHPKMREQKEWKDWTSLAEKMRPGTTGEAMRPALDAPMAFRRMQPVVERNAVPDEVQAQYEAFEFPEQSTAVRGIGRTAEGEIIDPVAQKNADDFARNPGNYDGKIYIVRNDQSTKIGTAINYAYQMEGKPPPVSDPQNMLRVFVSEKATGKKKPIGYMPEPRSIDPENPYNINLTASEIAARLRKIFIEAKTPAELKTALQKDRAFMPDNTNR